MMGDSIRLVICLCRIKKKRLPSGDYARRQPIKVVT